MQRFMKLITAAVAVALLGVLALLAIRGIIAPAGGAAAFGIPAGDPASRFYHAVYRDRNLTIAVVGFVFLALSMWRALAILATVSISLPLYDIVALVLAGVPVVAVHPATLVALIVFSALLWWRVSVERAPAR